ncbi:fibrobacter succinogenes major paralogous domain-containing protein [Bacteroides sp. ET71]|uniref:fibrobacter succinogenes major paralogous domain-containing protein n=1 Tax=Bacteroides sp. ET71 TaxID=2939421 RepID=UPI002013A8D0|nr:fibrobacter succinogenes major paralogous domain-containing protein [Bacteroides sp. ET71]MCL1617335.1 fibrobacter succinogenes major paralogous domain-containing protein [Bacteroides sp. ET71]
MKKIFNISLFLLFFLLAASCADEELIQTSGYRDGEAVTLSFNISVPDETEVAVTRATSSSEKWVENLTLLVFSNNSDDGVLEQVCTSYSGAGEEFNKGTMTPVNDTHKKFTVTLTASTEEKAIYILANAGYLLFKKLDDDFTLQLNNTTLKDLRDLQTYTTPPNFIMSGYKVLPIPHADLMTQDFPIYRSHAKVTVDVAKELQEKFTLQGFYLCNAQKDASVVAYPLYEQSSSTLTLPESTDDPDEETIDHDGWNRFESKPTMDEEKPKKTQYPAPTRNEAVANDRNTKLFLLVKGEYTEEGQSVTYYYHADFKTEDDPLDVRPNHHYKVTITDVDRIGYRHSLEGLKGAIAGAENATVDIKDINPDSHNMASDGVTEIGVESDTLYITGTEEEGPKVEFPVTVYPSIKNDNATINIDIEEEDQSWLALATTNGFPTVENEVSINNRPDKYSISTVTLKTKLANISGERREARVGISCRGVLTYVTVVQDPEFSAWKFGTVSLKVKEYERDNDWEPTLSETYGPYPNYWDFLKNDNVYGINPEAMGGKVRTEGFHAPMSDFQQFVYTFTVPKGNDSDGYKGCTWRIELAPGYEEKLLFWIGKDSPANDGMPLSEFNYRTDQEMNGQTFTFTNSLLKLHNDGKITKDAYRYGEKAFRIVVTHPDGTKETYAYDLYHTGVFNYDDGSNAYQAGTQTDKGWYYYEVILMGRNYWLDRNLGAKSSAYYSKAMRGSDEDAAGGLYRIANAPDGDGEVNIISGKELEKIAPKGFRVPYMSEFQALTTDSRFRQEFVYGTGGGYWDARYETGNPDQGTVYFPKNGMWYGDAAAGTGDTGYYWTQTAALGASGDERGYWLQNMQLSGSNASANRYRIYQNGTQNPTGMSVRCVYNSRVVEMAQRVEFYVKGYTHVYLFNLEDDGSHTPLNTWPGQMICINNDAALGMYHTFTFESPITYDNLHVVFNIVADEGITSYPTDGLNSDGIALDENNKFFQGTNWTNTAQ